MSRIRLNFARLSVTDKIAKARQIVMSLTGNASFPTPTPPLAAITAAIDALETAHSESQLAKQVSKTRTSAQSVREDELDRIMSQLAAYVESVSSDNEELIRSAGMDTRVTPSAASDVLTVPPALSATAGDHDGEVDLAWDKVAGARSYIIERSVDPPTTTSWGHA